jgi:hypothetical protein
MRYRLAGIPESYCEGALKRREIFVFLLRCG